jgi:hypothetical protein
VKSKAQPRRGDWSGFDLGPFAMGTRAAIGPHIESWRAYVAVCVVSPHRGFLV